MSNPTATTACRHRPLVLHHRAPLTMKTPRVSTAMMHLLAGTPFLPASKPIILTKQLTGEPSAKLSNPIDRNFHLEHVTINNYQLQYFIIILIINVLTLIQGVVLDSPRVNECVGISLTHQKNASFLPNRPGIVLLCCVLVRQCLSPYKLGQCYHSSFLLQFANSPS